MMDTARASPRGVLEGASRPFTAAVSECGLRSLARTDPEQTLLARFEYTGVQREARALRWRAVDGGLIAWFENDFWRLHTGLHEGIVLGREADSILDWVPEVVEASGARLYKLTRVAVVPEVDGLGQQIRTHSGAGWTVVSTPKKTREVLKLAGTFPDMLAGLGRHTRRNIRAALKVAAAERLSFELLTEGRLAEPLRAALAARTDRHRLNTRLMAGLETYADRTKRPFRSVARDADGRVVSYGCGYFGAPAAAFLLYQLNDPDWNSVGPSLLHRALLIEQLIEAGCRELVFVHGCSGVLRHACERQLLEEFLFTRRSVAAYLTTSVISVIKPNTSIGRLARLTLSRKPQAEGQMVQDRAKQTV